MKKTKRVLLTSCLFGAACFAAGFCAAGRTAKEIIDGLHKSLDKTERREQVLDNWLMAKKYGVPMDRYLLQKGISRVAVYGTQQMGIRLCQELKDTPVRVVCTFDRNPKHLAYGIPNHKTPDAAEVPLDAVIVSNFLLFDEIEQKLKQAGYTNIISLDELLLELMEAAE